MTGLATAVKVHVPFVDLRGQYLTIREEIRAAIDDVLESTQFVGGKWVEKLEQEFARFVGAGHAVALSSGTAALELALKVAGIGPGHEVIVPANTFFATAEAVSNVGARPVFADVVPRTFHLDIDSAEQLVTAKTKAIIPVHLYGRVCDMTEVERLASKHGLQIIEDAAQSHGATRGGRPVGPPGRLTAFSFYPGKNLGAYGDAGAVTTNDADQASHLRMLRDHGSAQKYEHALIGTNARMSSIQAAVLCVKLGRLAEWNNLRRKHAAEYAAALRRTAVQPPEIPAAGEHVFHLFVVRTPKRNALREFLAQKGIETGIHYPVPLHLTEAYQALGYPGRGTLPASEQLADEILSLPMFPELTEEQKSYAISALQEFAG
jgi:dTDP-3-amino-3,4,6-trideoxy-alpha-D-glucose transaminase